MDVIFCDAADGGGSEEKKSIRFNPLAPSQFLDAIQAAIANGHIVFRKDQQDFFH